MSKEQDQELLNKTCAHAAYCLIEVAVKAIENAENYVDSKGWQATDMEHALALLDEVKDDLWRRM